MTTDSRIDDQVSRAVAMREQGDDEDARTLLLALVIDNPDHAAANLQCAWTHDKMGLEEEALPFYERAIEIGLPSDDLESALLGLGSTLRALGHYPESLEVLERAVDEFPENRALEVFLAMARYNNGKPKEAVEALLRLLIMTTSDQDIRSYTTALDIYSEDLDRIWL
jgi:tetratricopeptide (TPR) repeat protein